MKHFTFKRRQNLAEGAPRWRVIDPKGKPLALTETADKARTLSNSLNELRSLRVLLAWKAGQLATSQACAILGCDEKYLHYAVGQCLKRGFE